MGDSTIEFLPEQEALDEIVETVMRADRGEAPFALVLGSGFSRGLVPTASELVSESLPLWVKSRDENKEFDAQAGVASERADVARSFWDGFVARNRKRKLDLKLNSATGLPEDNGEAYRAAFSPRYSGAVGAPAEARRFQRALMQLNKPRLNAAHFLLASLLGVQPGKTRASSLFRARAAFSRLILTTNFDPFLQIALQAVNRLYFMSDTPELGVSDEIFDDQTDAIHLVYLHGSIHRRSQAATDDEIQRLKEKNARTLAPVLKRRGVIVLGYSGWDDAIVAALAACDGFDYRLYWCGLESDPLAKGAFGGGVENILRKHAAVYVRSAGAGNFMAQLCRGLVKGNPRLLDNPIGQLRDLLDSIDLKELEEFKPVVSEDPATPQSIQTADTATTLVEAKRSTIERLTQAELIFLGKTPDPTPMELSEHADLEEVKGKGAGATVKPPAEVKSNIQQVAASAQLAQALGNYEEVLKQVSNALELTDLQPSERVQLLALSALANYRLGRIQEANDEWTNIINSEGATSEQVAEALLDRAFVWIHEGKPEKAVADYTRLIEQLPDAPVGRVAMALNNRGVTWNQNGERDKALADFTRVLEMPDAPVDQIAIALNSRGVVWNEKGEPEKALADYNRLIEQLPEAPVKQLAQALSNRGWVRYQANDFVNFLRDTEAALDKQDREVAAFNLGLALLTMGRDDEALSAYRTAAAKFPNKIPLVLLDLKEASQKWLTAERARPILQLFEAVPDKPIAVGDL